MDLKWQSREWYGNRNYTCGKEMGWE